MYSQSLHNELVACVFISLGHFTLCDCTQRQGRICLFPDVSDVKKSDLTHHSIGFFSERHIQTYVNIKIPP